MSIYQAETHNHVFTKFLIVNVQNQPFDTSSYYVKFTGRGLLRSDFEFPQSDMLIYYENTHATMYL